MILKRTAITFAIQIGAFLLGLAIAILVTRVTGAGGKGVYTLVGLVAQLATMVAALGIGWASIYYVGSNLQPLRDVASTVLSASLVSSVVAMLLVGLSYVALRQSYFRDVSAIQIGIAVIAVPLMQLNVAFGYIVLGMNRPLHFSSLGIAQAGTTLALLLVMIAGGRLTPTTALVSWLAGVAASVTLAAWLVYSRTPFRLGFSRSTFRALLTFGVKGYIANLIMLLNYRLDALILNGIAGAASVGFYSIAVAMAEAQWYIANTIGLVLFPHVSSSDRREADRITPIICRNTIFITFLSAIAMLVLGRTLILILFGPAMLPAVAALWLLLPGIVTASAAKVIASYLSGIGKPIYATYISSSHLALTVILDLTLIPRYGIYGAAIASSIVYTSAAAFSVIVFMRESHNSLTETIFVNANDIARYMRVARTTYSRITSLGAAAS
jgi:O-antigen/teichoic acid export membrane protein